MVEAPWTVAAKRNTIITIPPGPAAVLYRFRRARRSNPVMRLGRSAMVHVKRSADVHDPVGGHELDRGLQSVLDHERGRGAALPSDVADEFGRHMGADFSHVRLHTDGPADELAQSVAATAFTAGSDVFFRQGAYAPGTDRGDRLLAHELTHVAEGHSGPSRSPSASTVGEANAPEEAEAERNADRVLNALRRSRSSLTAASEESDGRRGGLLRRSTEQHTTLRRDPGDDEGTTKTKPRPRGINLGSGGSRGGKRGDPRRHGVNLGDGSDLSQLSTIGEQQTKGRERGRNVTAEDALEAFKDYMKSPANRIIEDNIPSSKLGRFDAEYDPEAGILAITVRPRFTFTGTWTDSEKTTFATEFQQQVATKWTGQHDFVCTKQGMESLRARVVVRVEPAGPGDRAHFECTVQDQKSGDTFIGRQQYADPTQLGQGMFAKPDSTERPHDNLKIRCTLALHDYSRIELFLKENMTMEDGRAVIRFTKDKINPEDAKSLENFVKILKQTTELGATPVPIVVTRHEKGVFSNGKKRAEAVRAILAQNGHYPIRIESAASQLATLKSERKKALKDYQEDNNTGYREGGRYDKEALEQIDKAKDSLESTNVEVHADMKWAMAYKDSDPYSILAHEFGHMLGNPDEYFGYGPSLFKLKKDQLLETGREGDAQVAKAMSINPETSDDTDDIQGGWGKLVARSGQKIPVMTAKGSTATSSMMNAGTIVLPAHYATIWEALGRITSRAVPGIQEKDWAFEG
jgi:hypothetical protein